MNLRDKGFLVSTDDCNKIKVTTLYKHEDIKKRVLKFENILSDLENMSKIEFDDKYDDIKLENIPEFLLNKFKEIMGEWKE